MKSIRFAPIAMILMLALGALPAAAEHRHRNDDRGLERLSFALSRSAHELMHELESSRRGHARHSRVALRSLQKLDREASQFHRQVLRKGVTSHGTQRAFRQLQASYRDASRHFAFGARRPAVRHDFRDVAGLMAQVEQRMARRDDRRDTGRIAGFGRGFGPGAHFAWNGAH